MADRALTMERLPALISRTVLFTLLVTASAFAGVPLPDVDSDGIPDGSDNCPLAANPGQEDYDGNGVGDACEPDCNSNGVPDSTDLSRSDLLVCSWANNQVLRFDATTGAFREVFTTGAGRSIAMRSDGDIFVVNRETDSVLHFTGLGNAPPGGTTFVPSGSAGMTDPDHIIFGPGPNGDLYISDIGTDAIYRFDRFTGAPVNGGVFVASGSGGLVDPSKMVFGPDGNLYVGYPNQILRYDGQTGAYLGVFATGAGNPLSGPTGMVFGPGGHLYVGSFGTNYVLLFHGITGAYLGVFASGQGNPLSGATDIAFGPDGHLYVTNLNFDDVLRFNGSTGAYMGEFAVGGGLDQPTALVFALGTSTDCNSNGLPDDCEMTDCNANGAHDSCDINSGASADCNTNDIPDECDIDPLDPDGNKEVSGDCNSDGVPDECVVAPPGLVDGIDPGTQHRIFVTSTMHNGDFNGYAGACAECAARAAAAGLQLTYKAILSDSYGDARDRIQLHDGELLIFENTGSGLTARLVLSSASDLWSGGTLVGPIRFDETGTYVGLNQRAWTGTIPNGTVALFEDCSDWTDGIGDFSARVGNTSANNSQWVSYPSSDSCDGVRRLYCISQSTAAQLDCDSNGVPDECDPDLDANGVNDACDCNGNGVLDSLDLARTDLLVCSWVGNKVLRFDSVSGAFREVFTTGAGRSIAMRLDGDIFVVNRETDSVLYFTGMGNAPPSGTIFVPSGSAGITDPDAILFGPGPNGDLYLGDIGTDAIYRFNRLTGAPVNGGVFVSSGSGGLVDPSKMTFGPGGHLYVCSSSTNKVLRYNGQTGAFMDVFASGDGTPLSGPSALVFGPDGDLYVGSFGTNLVLRYDGLTGVYLGIFASGEGNPLSGVTDLAFGPDGHLYVSNLNFDDVLRFNGTTGAYIGEFAVGGGLDQPTALLIATGTSSDCNGNAAPDECEDHGDFDLSRCVDLLDLPAFVAALLDPQAYCIPLADMNYDGESNGRDIRPFTEAIVAGPACP